ncbi:4-oxalomesaconate tautomerase [Actinomadura chibensis]|uniref:4-oxalomesaconate tautomerase n=2 Tax=Actinomadura chibensis TaxID=392828 RepID=A0A5D0NDW5_9ACTN|nr:4-oxalomesaconate tautomerase [Actinomadura chibensis]
MVMRGGTSKGAYFLRADLPADPAERDGLLLRIMGSPDPRQIDGIGGAHPLTSKVAVVSPAAAGDADVDYLFLQVGVDEPLVSDRQNCGNLLAGVGQFAVERGLVKAGDERTSVRIHMVNSDELAVSTFPTPGGRVDYGGDAVIAGVPGAAAPVVIDFATGDAPPLPTGRARDVLGGVPVTCVDNGMPVVVVAAADLGVTGYEDCAELEGRTEFRARLEALRLAAGTAMGLGDVRATTVPKVTLVAPPRAGGTVCTRTFVPHRCHTSIGVLGGAGVAAACLVPGSVAHALAVLPPDGAALRLEHPTGHFDLEIELDTGGDAGGGAVRVRRTAAVRSARKLFDGTVFPRPANVQASVRANVQATNRHP